MFVNIEKLVVELGHNDIVDMIGPSYLDSAHFEFNREFGLERYSFEPIRFAPDEKNLQTLQTQAVEELKKKCGVHYFASAGYDDEDGCTVFNGLFDDKRDAAQQLADLYDLTPAQQNELVAEGRLDLEVLRHGVGYVAISECSCDEPDMHED